MKLDVESVAAQRSFVFLWCGSAEGLDQGRAVRTTDEGEMFCFQLFELFSV